ncbi:MAG: lysozyme inhibitor LprI family protein [Terriglobales bacterium]
MRGRRHVRWALIGVLLLFAVISTPSGLQNYALAQVKHSTASCDSETTTAAMRNCENLRYQQAEKALDSTYAELMKKLDETGREKLRAAEKVWLQYREADATFQADTARGGTLAPLIRITVMSDMTETRVAELKKSLQP